MEKPQLTAINWVGQSLRGFLVRDSVSQVDGVSAMALTVSVALCGEGSENGKWPLPTFLEERKQSPSSLLDARHFSSFLYATDAFKDATLVLELRGSESE